MDERKKKSNKPSKKYLWGNLLAMAVTVCLLVFLTFRGLAIYTRHGEDIVVPSLKGMPIERAVTTLESSGIKCVVADSGYMPQLPANTVLDQSVKAGSKVKEGRIVNVTVNSVTPPLIVMPDLADNSSLREAQSRLRAIGFSLAPTEYIKGEKDWVYEVKCGGREISADTRISIDSKITLVAGDGTANEYFQLEDDSLWEVDSSSAETDFDETLEDGISE